jgi:hypothetical protein
MLRLLPRRRARIISLGAQAEALIRELGIHAYDEARRREIEASSDAMARDWGRVAEAIAQRTDAGVDASTKTTPEADFAPCPGSGAANEIPPNFGPCSGPPEQSHCGGVQQFRVQFIRVAHDREPSILKEVGLQADDMEAAIVAAAGLTFPPTTSGLRIIDRDGREVFARQKDNPRPSELKRPASRNLGRADGRSRRLRLLSP